MPEKLIIGAVVNTPDGTGRIYKLHNDQVVVITCDNDMITPQLYKNTDIEVLYCESCNKYCNYHEGLLLTYPDCCEYCKLSSTLDNN